MEEAFNMFLCVCVMLSKGNWIPRWQVAMRANGRPRQIKSNGHLSCWQLKSHLSNYSWCSGLEIKPIISTRGTNDVEPGTMDCFKDQWTSSGSKLNWKTINNCFTSNDTFAACDGSWQRLATFLWDIGDRTELEWETIDVLVRGQSLSTLCCSHISCIETLSLIHYGCIVYSSPWSQRLSLSVIKPLHKWNIW